MNKSEITRYQKLNELADNNGIVIFGGSVDSNIPLGEIRQAFSIEEKMYNRSIPDLSVNDAVDVYEKCVAVLTPETLLLHIGEADLKFFEEDPNGFDKKYRELITYIKTQDKNCRIAIVSLRNYDHNTLIGEMNKHLKYIADSESCEYGDISDKKVWNPKSTKEAVSFVYSIGFAHSLRNERPVYDLVRMLFCSEM